MLIQYLRDLFGNMPEQVSALLLSRRPLAACVSAVSALLQSLRSHLQRLRSLELSCGRMIGPIYLAVVSALSCGRVGALLRSLRLQ